MNKATKIGLAVLVLAVAFTAGRFSKPSKVEEKIVTKIEVVKEEAKTRIIYRDRVTSPDGTITEKEVETEETNTRTESNTASSSDKIVRNDVGLTLAALAIAPIKDIGGDREYALVASKRVLGGLKVAASITTDKKLGLGLGWSF